MSRTSQCSVTLSFCQPFHSSVILHLTSLSFIPQYPQKNEDLLLSFFLSEAFFPGQVIVIHLTSITGEASQEKRLFALLCPYIQWWIYLGWTNQGCTKPHDSRIGLLSPKRRAQSTFWVLQTIRVDPELNIFSVYNPNPPVLRTTQNCQCSSAKCQTSRQI